MTTVPIERPRWRKSTRSDGPEACVELANTGDMARDSKNPTGPTLRINAAALVAAVKDGQLKR